MDIENNYYKVLDHGYVALVDFMGGDQMIEKCARQSYIPGTRDKTDTRKLIRHLVREHHTSPFECTEFHFQMALPLFVQAQLVRTRTANISQYSGRYAVMPEMYYEPKEWRLQSKENKQGSASEELDVSKSAHADSMLAWVRYTAEHAYKVLLDFGVAKELARMVLPQNLYTYWHFKIDAHNLMHLLKLRTDPHTQWETRQYANIMAAIFQQLCPITFEAWMDYQYYAVTLSKKDRELLHELLKTIKKEDWFVMHDTPRELHDFLKKIDPPDEANFSLPKYLSAQEVEANIQEALQR